MSPEYGFFTFGKIRPADRKNPIVTNGLIIIPDNGHPGFFGRDGFGSSRAGGPPPVPGYRDDLDSVPPLGGIPCGGMMPPSGPGEGGALDGFPSPDSLSCGCPMPTQKPSRKDVQRVFNEADLNKDGQVSKDELEALFDKKLGRLLSGKGDRKLKNDVKMLFKMLKNFDKYAGKMGDKKTMNSEEANSFWQETYGSKKPFAVKGSDSVDAGIPMANPGVAMV